MFATNITTKYNKNSKIDSSKNLMVFFIIFLIVFFFTNTSQALPMARGVPRHYCGTELSQRLRDLCAGKYPSRFRRDVDGIVGECCRRPCTDLHLLSYCNSVQYSDNSKPNTPSTYHSQKPVSHLPHPPQPDHQNEEPNGMRAVMDAPVQNRQLSPPSSASLSLSSSEILSRNSTINSGFPYIALPERRKVRKYNKRKRKNGKGCRCRKRNRHPIDSDIICFPCHKTCRNVNKSPVTCQSIKQKKKKKRPSFEIATISSAESNPHIMHDLSHPAWHSNTDHLNDFHFGSLAFR